MKKTAILLAVAALVLAAPLALAGDYHRGATLICSDCHIMHGSQAHGYNANGTGPVNAPGPAAPYEKMLRNEVSELCIGCHDGKTTAPDVLDANTNAYVRSAGALNRSGAAPYYHQTGHTLGSTDVAPGGTWSSTTGLACGSCHSTHNSSSYNSFRNIRRVTVGAETNVVVDYAAVTQDQSKDVFEVVGAGTPGVGMADHYGVSNVYYNEPVQTKSDYGTFCKSCHTNFHGTSGDLNMNDGEEWLRHPTADADFSGSMLTQYNTHTNKLKVMRDLADPVGGATPSTATPSCMTCHKSHGNQNAFGLVYMPGEGTLSEEGDALPAQNSVRYICKQCHTTGGPD